MNVPRASFELARTPANRLNFDLERVYVRSASGCFQRAACPDGNGEASAVSRLRYQPIVLFVRWNFHKNPIFTSIVDLIRGCRLEPLRLMECNSCHRLSTSRNGGAAAAAHVIERKILA
jgi:hypothetical protein